MEEAIAKAGALIEAMEYIRSFRSRIVVVKLGGSVLDDTDLQKKLLAGSGLVCPPGLDLIAPMVDYVRRNPEKSFLDDRAY